MRRKEKLKKLSEKISGCMMNHRKETLKKLSEKMKFLVKKRHELIRELDKVDSELNVLTNERLTIYQERK